MTEDLDKARRFAGRIEEAIRDGAAEYWKASREAKVEGDLPSYITRAVLAVLPGGNRYEP